MHQSFAAGVAILLSIGLPAAAAETPKRGGALTYMIPADAPPSFDGHREGTFATVHAVAPFYRQRLRAETWWIRLRSSVAEGEVTTTSLMALVTAAARARRSRL